MSQATSRTILDVARQKGVITPSDVRALGLAPENLNRLTRQGLLVHTGRGTFEDPNFEATEMHTYVEVALTVPTGVFCLLTALRIHDVGTQNPHEVWIAVPRKNRVPRDRTVRLRVVRMSPIQFESEIQTHEVEGATIRVYSLEKTIVDCFRLRHLVGYEVGPEALKEAIRERKLNIARLADVANKLNAGRTIRPYVEALVS